MGTKTEISWTDATWNPVTGCSRVSPGCEHCYAEALSLRFKTTPFPWTANHAAENVQLHPERLTAPLHWTKPRRVFVNSMSDLFHEQIPDDFVDAVFGVMLLAKQHTFQILTKRPERMLRYLTRPLDERKRSHGRPFVTVPSLAEDADLRRALGVLRRGASVRWPLPNVWLGVSVEDQRRADERIPLLLATPAAVRFLSCEPLLGVVDLGLNTASCSCCPRWSSRWVRLPGLVSGDFKWGAAVDAYPGVYRAESNRHGALAVRASDGSLLGIKPAEFEVLPGVDWVIAGGESGSDFRPMDLEWARHLRDQCVGDSVPFFYKQSAGRFPGRDFELDGRVWRQFPVIAAG